MSEFTQAVERLATKYETKFSADHDPEANIADFAVWVLGTWSYERGRTAGERAGLAMAITTVQQLMPEPEDIKPEPADDATTIRMQAVPFGDGNPEERI